MMAGIGPLPNLGPTSQPDLGGGTPYDWFPASLSKDTSQYNYGWKPFQTVQTNGIVINADGTYSQVPQTSLAQTYTTNPGTNIALAGNVPLISQGVAGIAAELAGLRATTNAIGAAAPAQTGSLLGGNMGLGYLNAATSSPGTSIGTGTGVQPQAPAPANAAGSLANSSPGIATFVPSSNGIVPIAGTNRFTLTPQAQQTIDQGGPQPYNGWGYPMLPTTGPQQVETAPAPSQAMAMASSSATAAPVDLTGASAPTSNPITSAAQGQYIAPSQAPTASVASNTAFQPFNAADLLGGINPNDALTLNAQAGSGNENDMVKNACANAVSIAGDTYQSYLKYIEDNKGVKMTKDGTVISGGATGATQTASAAGATGGANPQMAQMGQLLTVLAQLLTRYAAQNGGQNSPEFQQIQQLMQQFQQIAQQGGEVGTQATQAINTINAATGNTSAAAPASIDGAQVNTAALKALATTKLKGGPDGSCVATAAENLDEAFKDLPANLKPVVYGPTGHAKQNNSLNAMAQMVKSGDWISIGGNQTSIATDFGTITVNQMRPEQFKQMAESGAIPKGALVFQTSYPEWDHKKPARGNDTGIFNGKGVTNYAEMPALVYGQSAGPVVVMLPKAKGAGSNIA